jgi:vacuolar protein sorting-associated protein 3
MCTVGHYADRYPQQQSYVLQSRQSLPLEKPIEDIVLVPSISRLLIQSGPRAALSACASLTIHTAHQVFFYTLPSLDPVPQNLILPLRNVVTFAVDERHLARAPLSIANPQAGGVEPIDFCVIKRSSIALFQLRERLFFQKVIEMPS